MSKYHLIFSQSSHSFLRKCTFAIQFLYLASQLVTSWFQVATMYLSLMIIFSPVAAAIGGFGSHLLWTFSVIYGGLVFVLVRAAATAVPTRVLLMC